MPQLPIFAVLFPRYMTEIQNGTQSHSARSCSHGFKAGWKHAQQNLPVPTPEESSAMFDEMIIEMRLWEDDQETVTEVNTAGHCMEILIRKLQEYAAK